MLVAWTKVVAEETEKRLDVGGIVKEQPAGSREGLIWDRSERKEPRMGALVV